MNHKQALMTPKYGKGRLKPICVQVTEHKMTEHKMANKMNPVLCSLFTQSSPLTLLWGSKEDPRSNILPCMVGLH